MSLFALRGVGHVNTHLEYGMGDCFVCGRGFTRIGECRTYFSVAPAIKVAARDWSAKQLYWLAASGWCSTPEVADSGRWESSLMATASGDLREGDDWQSPPKWDDWHALSKWICSWADAGVSGKKYVCANVDTGTLVSLLDIDNQRIHTRAPVFKFLGSIFKT